MSKKQILIDGLLKWPKEEIIRNYVKLLEETAEQKKDIKILTKVMFKICLILGFVDENKEVKADLSTSAIVRNASSVIGNLLMPGGTNKFNFVYDLIPLLKKYKNNL